MEDVKFVINFDYPNNSEDYVHRIGRTGRSHKTGTAYTFFTQSNAKQAADLVSVLTEANQTISPKLKDIADGWRSNGFSGRGKQILLQIKLILLNNIETNSVIINMYLETLFIKIGKHWRLILLQLKKLLND